MGTARNMFPSKDKRDLRQPILVEDLIQYDDLNGTGGGGGSGVTQITAGTNVTISSTGPSGTGNVTINATGGGGGGTVTGVTATSPITSSGGTAPVISTSMATNRLIGRTDAGTGVMQEITVGTGLSLSAGTLTNTGLTATPTIQQTITAGKSITNDILTIGTNAGDNISTISAVAIGQDSLKNVNGGKNIGIGTRAGYNNLGGIKTNSENISIGYDAGTNQADNLNNVIAIGTNALIDNQSSGSIAIGKNAGLKDTGGPGRTGANVFIGKNAGHDPVLPTVGNDAGGVIAIGELTVRGNTGNNTIAIGTGTAYQNSGTEVNIIGYGAGGSNTGSNVNFIGTDAGSGNTGTSEVIGIGTQAAKGQSGSNVVAIGTTAGFGNTGSNVIAIGYNAGNSNAEPNSFIISNSSLPLFATQADAITHYTSATGLSTGCTYLYFNDDLKTIEGYRT